MVSLIGAGYDTTTGTASWMVLRARPGRDVWSQLRAEATAIAADDPRPYADAVVHESLRIHPAGAYAPRLVARSFDLGPYRVRRGSLIAWSPLLVGRDPQTWPDPMRFDPDRHLDGTEPEYAWVPFGAGSRSCLGFGLARMNLTLLASRLAERLDLEVVSEELPEPVGTVTSHPAGGLRHRRPPLTGSPLSCGRSGRLGLAIDSRFGAVDVVEESQHRFVESVRRLGHQPVRGTRDDLEPGVRGSARPAPRRHRPV